VIFGEVGDLCAFVSLVNCTLGNIS